MARDYTKYSVNNETFVGKGKLARLVLEQWINANGYRTLDQLQEIFKDEIQGSAFLRSKEDVESNYDRKRFDLTEVPCEDKVVLVSNQWGTHNIDALLELAEQINVPIYDNRETESKESSTAHTIQQNEIRDSYKNFFKKFEIDKDEFIEYGVKEDTIYPDPIEIREEWDKLKRMILNGGDSVSIRKYGRSGGSQLYIELYSILFPNCRIKLDPTNNAGPRKVLEASTSHSKYGKNKTIQNYQVAHVKGCTKNPLLFTAPWNIVWIPKIFDPFTGHESHGIISEKYKTAFLKYWSTKYEPLIREYNELILEHCSEKKLKSALTTVKMSSNLDENLFKRFEISVFEELSQITI